MTALAPPVRDRLIGSLELATRGATAGEQLAACCALGRLLEAHRLNWSDLIVDAGTRRHDEAPAPDPDDDLSVIGRWPGGFRALAADCIKHGAGILSAWEIEFCRNCAIIRCPSRKQTAILRRLLERLVLEGRFA